MRAGTLDRRVTIQRSTPSQNLDGSLLDSWGTVGPSLRPAGFRSLQADERFTAPQLVAREQVEFTVRYDDTLADLNPKDRVIYPALTSQEVNSPPNDLATRRIYDIVAVQEGAGRRDSLKIIAARQADVTV